MLDATRPFADSVTVLAPYLEARSVGGALMTLGHLIFAGHFVALLAQGRAPHATTAPTDTVPATQA
jgi:cytochrome c oxidase cbb3-type subunit 1